MADTGRKQNSKPEFQDFPLYTVDYNKLEDRVIANQLQQEDVATYLLSQKPEMTLNIAREWIRTEFNLPRSLCSKCSTYFMRVYPGSWVMDSVKEGVFSHSGREKHDYIVHWQSTPACVKSAAKVACSFREYEGSYYVVVKVWQGELE